MDLLPSSLSCILSTIFDSSSPFLFLDIGAYRGDFTRSLIYAYPNAIGLLFEPTPMNYLHLQQLFLDSNQVRVLNFALSHSFGTRSFYLCEDSATNSLLQPTHTPQESFEVPVTTLDRLLLDPTFTPFKKRINIASDLQFIKIDTQGNDLNVLKGGLQLLEICKPLVLVEFIFSDLYTDQGSYYSIFNFFSERFYSLSGIYNIHYSKHGMIAYADFLFIPNRILALYPKLFNSSPIFDCFDGDYWIRQSQVYERICAERLDLINNLSNIADERLKLIELLDKEVTRLKKESDK